MYGSQGNSGMRNVARPYFNSGKGHAEGIQWLMMLYLLNSLLRSCYHAT